MLKLVMLLAATAGLLQVPAAPAPATLSGLVVARDGGFLPGVTVTLEGPAPASPRKVVTDREGRFRLADVPPATYMVRFELSGFITYARPRLVLAAGTPASLTVALELGPLREPIDRAAPVPTFTLAAGEVAVAVETSAGTFHIAVDTKRAPITATNFLKYVDAGLYDQGRFHRATRADNYTPALPNRPMMNIIQGGINPERRAEGFAAIPLERTSVTGITHVTGVVSMARGTGADTATSDFFVLLDDQPSLDFGGRRFDDGQGGAAFGHVLSGLDVVRKIQQQPVDGQNLSAPVTIRRVWRVGSVK